MTARIHSLAAWRDAMRHPQRRGQVVPETLRTVAARAGHVEVDMTFVDGLRTKDALTPEAAREFAALLIEAADDAEARTR